MKKNWVWGKKWIMYTIFKGKQNLIHILLWFIHVMPLPGWKVTPSYPSTDSTIASGGAEGGGTLPSDWELGGGGAGWPPAYVCV